MRHVFKLVAGIAALYLLVVAVIYANQRSLVFSASTERVQPAAVGLIASQEITLRNSAEESLFSWYTPAAQGRRTILYLHGNGGSVSTRGSIQQQFINRGFGIFMVGYPGYGGSEGAASETALVATAHLAYGYLTGSGVLANDIVMLGESLGSSVTIQLAANKPAAAVVLLAPMHSIREIAESQYPFLPMQLLLKDPFLTFEHIANVQQPLLVFHGSNDEAIPITSGKRLFDLANPPKLFKTVDGAGHNNLFDFAIIELIEKFLADHSP